MIPLMQTVHHEYDKHHHDGDLHQHKQGVKVGDQIHTLQVRQRQDRHKPHHPDPRRDFREQRGKVDLRQQHVDHRQEEIVQQRGPADHKPQVGSDRFLRVGVRRARFRELSYQFAVADGGKHDASQRQEIRGGHVAVADTGHNTEGIKHGHGGEISQPHHDHLPELEGTAQPGSAGHARRVKRGVSRHKPSPPCLPWFAIALTLTQTCLAKGEVVKNTRDRTSAPSLARTHSRRLTGPLRPADS